MLMNHKNFHLTQFPDKTNDVIFLKSPKTLFLGHFWSFLPIGNFFQKIRLCHIKLYLGSWRHAKFQEKLISQFRENLRTDGRTDTPYFIGLFRTRPKNFQGSFLIRYQNKF